MKNTFTHSLLLLLIYFLSFLFKADAQTLYGTTFSGGPGGGGTIGKYSVPSGTLTVEKGLEVAEKNPFRSHLIQASDGKLYGMTAYGGSSNAGVIFSVDPVTTTYKKLKNFGGTDGAYPYGSLLQASDGKLYGMTSYGGSSYAGVIFSFDPVTSTYSRLKDFDWTDGAYPYGNLIQARDGKLYGMTLYGGSGGNGVIFSIDPATSVYTKLKDFNYADGAYPLGNLIQAADGKFYGMTVGGGSSANGVIFSFNPHNAAYKKLKDFSSTDGTNPNGSLMQAQDGKLYGMTTYGGSSEAGVIFSFNPHNAAYKKLKDFSGADGGYPNGSLMEAANGKIYGMTTYGGSSDNGVFFSFAPTPFSYSKLKDFGVSEGEKPSGSLALAPDGKLYGMTTWGGSRDKGVIFSYDPATSLYTRLKDFNQPDGAYPYGSLVKASNGKLYGMTLYGGSNDYGVIFSFDPVTSTFAKLKDFEWTDGAWPLGSLMQASDGKLYGMTTYGGNHHSGVIFSLDPATSLYTKLKDFNQADGAYPYGSLMQAANGKLYGMTAYGGGSHGESSHEEVSYGGVIFSLDPATSTYTKLKTFDETNGWSPFGSLVQVSNRKLYGMTFSGGSNGSGVIFSFHPVSSAYSKVKDFNGTDGAYPYGNLIQARDGKLYGMTAWGGSHEKGVAFSFDLASTTYRKVKDFNGANGAQPYLGSAFIELGSKAKTFKTSTGTGTLTGMEMTNGHRVSSGSETLTQNKAFQIRVSPNPSRTTFRVVVESNSPEPLTLRLTDLTGRLVETITVKSNEPIILGSTYKEGSYFAEVVQGTSRKVVKLIKRN